MAWIRQNRQLNWPDCIDTTRFRAVLFAKPGSINQVLKILLAVTAYFALSQAAFALSSAQGYCETPTRNLTFAGPIPFTVPRVSRSCTVTVMIADTGTLAN